VAAGLVSHNIVVPLRPGLSERNRVLLARAFVVLFGTLAYVMAFRAERVYELVEQASAFGSAGIVTVVFFGLFTRIGGTWSAVSALLAGVLAWIGGAYAFDLPYPYLTSLAIAVVSYLIAAAADRRPPKRLVPLDI
jgi:Na+/proline symporter